MTLYRQQIGINNMIIWLRRDKINVAVTKCPEKNTGVMFSLIIFYKKWQDTNFLFGENISQMSQKVCSFYRGDICPDCPYTMTKTVSPPDWCCRANTSSGTVRNHHQPPPGFPIYTLTNSSWVACGASVAGGTRTGDHDGQQHFTTRPRTIYVFSKTNT